MKNIKNLEDLESHLHAQFIKAEFGYVIWAHKKQFELLCTRRIEAHKTDC